MSLLSATSFISSPLLSKGCFVRRPRSSRCERNPSLPCIHPSRHAIVRTHVVCMSEATQSDLIRGPDPGDISSRRGFALSDAPIHEFFDLRLQDDVFARGGAYAIRDRNGDVCYMGYSKNIAAKLEFHARLVPDDCASFQVYVPPVPAELISPEMLENVLEYWVRENGGVPRGNTVERARWERDEAVERKDEVNVGVGKHKQEDSVDRSMGDIPVRERTTARRVSVRRPSSAYKGDTFTDNFRSSTGTRRRKSSGGGGVWSDNDAHVEVDVDPLDPFSTSKNRGRKSWDFEAEDEEPEEDWVPIAALMGIAGFLWLLGVLSNTLPAASPSMGM